MRRGAAGFLLIEVLVALTVAAVALAALIRFQVEIQRAGTLAAQRADALMIAAGQIESLWAAIHAGETGAAGAVDQIDHGPDGEPLASGTVYLREWTLSAANSVVWINVVARWEGGDGTAHAVELSSAATMGAAFDSGLVAVRGEFVGLP